MDSRFWAIFFLLFAAMECDEWWLRLAKKQGPMVCVEERVSENERYFSTPWTGGKLCGTETIVQFSCCHGYDKIPGERGCPLVLPLKDLAETARSVGANRFVDHAEFSGMLPLLKKRGAYTLFAARDSAFSKLTSSQEAAVNSTRHSRSQPPILLFTVAEGRKTVDELPNILTTLYRQGSIIITKFPNGLVTANCIPLVSTDLEATNGLLQVTESLLLPSAYATVTDLIARSPDLATMNSALVRAQLGSELKEKGPFTVFAPVEAAWESLPQSFIEDIMGDSTLIRILLQHHILDSVWCSSAIDGESEFKTLGGINVRLWCNESGQYIDEARLLEGDHSAGNGFVHHIDTVLVPDKVRSLSDLLQLRDMTYFSKMAEAGGLGAILKRQGAYTVFAPSDEAFEDLPNTTLADLMSVSSLARSVASFHIVSGRHLTSTFVDGQRLGTLKGQESPLRIKRHLKLVSVESASVTAADIETRNGILHVLSQVMIPPTMTVVQVLEENGNFSTFLSILNQTEPSLLKALSNTSSVFTVFAPDNVAFNETPPGFVARLLADPPLLYKMTAHHIVESFISWGGMVPKLTYQHSDLNGSPLTVRREVGGSLTIANMATVEDPAVTATNGVVHKISRFLQV